jgi:MFS family permease
MSDVFGCKGVILASILMLGGGSLIGEDAQSMDLLLVGRSVQGLGAGGLTVSSYLTYGSLPLKIGDKFLTAVSFSIAVGTVCGPFFGAMLSHSSTWVSLAVILDGPMKLTTTKALDIPSQHTPVCYPWHLRVQYW